MTAPSFEKITQQDLEPRFKSLAAEFYSQMVFLVKGAVITVAAGAWLSLLAHPLPEMAEHWLFFASSCCVVLIPVATYRRGQLLASPRINIIDYIAPLGMGAAEVVMFTVLAFDRDNALPADFRVLWLYAVAAHALLAAILVCNRLALTPRTDFAEELDGLVNQYQKWLGIDLGGAVVFAFVAGALAYGANSLALAERTLVIGPFVLNGFDGAAVLFGVLAMFVALTAMSQHSRIALWFHHRS